MLDFIVASMLKFYFIIFKKRKEFQFFKGMQKYI